MVSKVSKERSDHLLGSKLRTEIDTKFGRTVCQQLDALKPAILESEIQTSPVIAHTD